MKARPFTHTMNANPVERQFARMGADGWIGLSWSRDLGGKELSHVEQYIFTDEVVRSGFAYPFLTTEAVAPVIAATRDNPVTRPRYVADTGGGSPPAATTI